MQEDNRAIYQMRFPQKLWYLINLRTDAILWGGTGRTILLNYRILYDYLQCDDSVFKTNNISSFVRQLNLYGFRKVTSHLQDPLCNSSNPFMHEYIHDYFQFGRPELLNKIIRKALNIKKSLKHRTICNDTLQSALITPLQKARRVFRLALKNAAQDYYFQNSSSFTSYEDAAEDSCEDEELDINMFYSKTSPPETTQPIILQDSAENEDKKWNIGNISIIENSEKAEEILMHKIEEQPASPNNETSTYPNQFLSMPDLDGDPVGNNGIELLGEFHINNDIDQGITKKACTKQETNTNDSSSLNCVLPFINSNYQQDEAMEVNDMDSGHYNGEWDQMFNEIIINKGHTQEYSSDLKELYSQISRTIDLLNT